MTQLQEKILAYIANYTWLGTCMLGLWGMHWMWIAFIGLTGVFLTVLIINLVILARDDDNVFMPEIIPEYISITIDTSIAFALLISGHYILATLIIAQIYLCCFLQHPREESTT